MQPTISIPQHWEYPRFALEQRTQQTGSYSLREYYHQLKAYQNNRFESQK
jgi:hypothetical protein